MTALRPLCGRVLPGHARAAAPRVRNKAIYVALGLTLDGDKEVLGLWIEQTEGAKFWLKVMNDLKT